VTGRRGDWLWLGAGLLGLWQAAFWVAGPDAVASPATTLGCAATLLQSRAFWVHAGASGVAFLYACLVALAGGLGLGLWLGFRRMAGEVADPILGSLYSIPKITLYPVILLVFGLGLSAKVAFGALHGIFPVAIFAMNAVRTVSPAYLKTARILRLSPRATVATVLLPAALPEIVTGLRVGFSTTLLGVLIGELFASNQGLGFALIRAMETHNVPDIMALTLLLFAVAAGANGLMLAVEHRLHRRTG
jgi:NitT/TauT family transport system permease protein